MSKKPQLQFSDYCSDPQGAAMFGVSVDNFRQIARKPGFPVAFKVGPVNFRRRDALEEYARQRNAARKAK
jgi:hypothetical protein